MTAEPRSVTLDEIMSWGPCYKREKLQDLAAGRERITAAEVLDLPIPINDRLWAVLRPELIDEKVMHEWACRCAERALVRERERGREPDARSWAAIQIKRAWMRGEATDGQLAAARAAARAAERAAERAAARAARAARAAARAAGADEAARAAWVAGADEAAWAAGAAAGADASAAEREAQIDDFKSLLGLKEDRREYGEIAVR